MVSDGSSTAIFLLLCLAFVNTGSTIALFVNGAIMDTAVPLSHQPYVDAYYRRLQREFFQGAFTMSMQNVYDSAEKVGMSGLWHVGAGGERLQLASVPPALPELLPKEDAFGQVRAASCVFSGMY
jgi:hypothetical protein